MRDVKAARRAWVLLVLVTALCSGLLTHSAHADPPRTITLIGTMQKLVGCATDWQADCQRTDLRLLEGTRYGLEVALPAGTYEYKFAADHKMDETYGADGVRSGLNLPLMIAGPTRLLFWYDDATHALGVAPTDVSGAASAADRQLAGQSLRNALTRERFYFALVDRFANGNRANDAGGLVGDRMVTGLDPRDKAFYHGGDLAGLKAKLPYIKGLGTTAIWLSPVFKNRPVQVGPDGPSAGYHGYWITDFTQVDPHLGTNAELTELIESAHKQGMKVFFDIITNHTADVIQSGSDYVSKENKPYLDAQGNPFDDASYVGKPDFPAVDVAKSFPYEPKFPNASDQTVKVPAWLNDPRVYHNRGNLGDAAESKLYGDFAGLDDLWTEREDVVKGMTDIYNSWVDFGVDGFRVDTVKHVNIGFWERFSPAVLAHALSKGKRDFFTFGEVYDSDPSAISKYTTTGRLPAALDFGFQAAALGFAQGKPTVGIRDLFAADDYYTDTDSNAYQLPTFLGNHDLGRVAYLLASGGARDDLLDRTKLATALLYLTRGQPVVYYGDEQGFIGSGGDQDARQDLFATSTAQYRDEEVLGSASGSRDRYDSLHPLYRLIADLAKLRQNNPGLSDGAQIPRFASNAPGIYSFSRISTDGREYVVALNNAAQTKSTTIQTYSPNTNFEPIYGTTRQLKSDGEGRLQLFVPALGAIAYRASSLLPKAKGAPAIRMVAPTAGEVIGGRTELGAVLVENSFAQVSFSIRQVGQVAWTPLGTDDAPPYRVFADVGAYPAGTLLEIRAVAKDRSGNLSANSTYASVGTPKAKPGQLDPSLPQPPPSAVSVAGSFNSEMGCPADWQPACAQAQLNVDPRDGVWKGTYTLPPGSYEYKAALDRGWATNYGAGGVPNGPNLSVNAPNGPVRFFFDPVRHLVTSDVQGPIVTAPGSFQSELGCGTDWAPDCMLPWLTDPDNDGTYTWSSSAIPPGKYEFKITHGLSWVTSFGENGAPNGANITMEVPSSPTMVTLEYLPTTHVVTVKMAPAAAVPSLGTARAVWVTRNLIAWPAQSGINGSDPATLRWQLHWAPAGGLGMDAETLGGSAGNLELDPAGLPKSVLDAYPHLRGYRALRLGSTTSAKAEAILRGQLAVAAYGASGNIVDASSVQIAGVLDDLYADAAGKLDYGVTWNGKAPFIRVWAPTAQGVALLLWPANAAPDAPVTSAKRVPMNRDATGSWSVVGQPNWNNNRYLFELKLYSPVARRVIVDRVTDPYSTALTLDSSRSVIVNPADADTRPANWVKAKAPVLASPVDQSIYELHVRDFSINDSSVPIAHRGSYLAFADAGAGTKHLVNLAKSGLNTVHLLPTYDFTSVPENPADQARPNCDLRAQPADSPEQQRCVREVADRDGFNWGYDPWHWLTPEGSYASTVSAADGRGRIAEYRTMVGALHANGLRVVQDVVFNHTTGAGLAPTSVLDRVVPGYYHRLDALGAVAQSTCCNNTATENAMAEKIMVDAVVWWARQYHVDGFRFDLMGHHTRANMLAVRAGLDALTEAKDGIDGKRVTLYGEGWNFGEVVNNARFTQATQGQLGGTHIATFSDRLRDAVRGGGPFDEDPRRQGFGTGLLVAPNGAGVNGNETDQRVGMAYDMDLVQLGMAGNLRSFTFRSNASAQVIRGDQLDYLGGGAGYADSPDEVISYVDAHDNETLFDTLALKLPQSTPMADRVRLNTVCLATVALGQSPAFWHAGTDLLRSKSLDRNSFNSGDWFNRIDFTGQTSGYGAGLPPQSDNARHWEFQRPLLADPALKPTAKDISAASAAAQELLKLRYSTKLFRLGETGLINQKVSFPASGTSVGRPGVIALRIDDTVGPDSDPELKGLVVIINATPAQVAQRVPGMEGQPAQLSGIQANGADPVVKAATWDAASGTASVPGYSVAVFVQPQ